MVVLMLGAVVVALLPLFFILVNLILKGAGSLSLDFFTRMPAPAGETGGGVAHALVGTLLIVVGVFAWAWIVAQQKHFSALAGSVALALLMIPMVLRTTEEMIKLVPNSLREAALALGYPRWRTSLTVVVRATLPGILTGGLLAVARIAGETAPLLFTALGSQYLSFDLDQPMAALPLTVFTYATGPYEEWHRYAWAAALVLIIVVFLLSLGARLAVRRRFTLNG
jgi:phosphate transport system permease protein